MTLQYAPPTVWVDDPETMMQMVRHVRDTGEAGMDTETTGLDVWRDVPILWSISPDEGSRYCGTAKMLKIFSNELAGDPNISWYWTNQNYDHSVLDNYGVQRFAGESFDTLAMDWLRDENRVGRHGLKECSWDYFGLHLPSFNETFPAVREGTPLLPESTGPCLRTSRTLSPTRPWMLGPRSRSSRRFRRTWRTCTAWTA